VQNEEIGKNTRNAQEETLLWKVRLRAKRGKLEKAHVILRQRLYYGK